MRAGDTTAGATVIIAALGDVTGRAVLKAVANIVRSGEDSTDVVMRGGDLSTIVDRAEEALLVRPIYQRGRALVRVIKLDVAIGGGTDVRRAVGSTMLSPAKDARLSEQRARS